MKELIIGEYSQLLDVNPDQGVRTSCIQIISPFWHIIFFKSRTFVIISFTEEPSYTMRTTISLFLILLIQCSLYAQNFEWAVGSNGYVCTGRKVTTDNFGNIYVTGGYEGLDMTIDSVTIPYEHFGSEIFVAKFNPQGVPLWIKSAQGYYNDWGLALSAKDDSQDIFQGAGFVSPELVVGEDTLYNSGSTNFYITRLNENGDKL